MGARDDANGQVALARVGAYAVGGTPQLHASHISSGLSKEETPIFPGNNQNRKIRENV